MPMPHDSARALHRAGEFIKELSSAGEWSERCRREAEAILRHYPSAAQIELIAQMSPSEIEPPAVHRSPTADSQNPGHFAHLYGVLTTQEMADHLKCSPEQLYDRAVAGELIFLSSPNRVGDRRYPAFQLDERLDKPLLRRTIKEYNDADVNSTLLWSFLRTSQKVYGGLTAIEMLVGGLPTLYETLSAGERSEVFLDVVAEEISRVRY